MAEILLPNGLGRKFQFRLPLRQKTQHLGNDAMEGLPQMQQTQQKKTA
jgi:hypothetical protein